MSLAFNKSGRTPRSPPGVSTNEATSSCQLCTTIDNMNIVQCDECDLWYHFECVGVNQSIDEKDFVCLKCLPPQQPKTMVSAQLKTGPEIQASDNKSRTSSRASSQRRKRLELQKLEEERQLAEKFAEKERLRAEKFAKEERQREQENLNKKYQILETASDSSDSAKDCEERANAEKVKNWVSTLQRNTSVPHTSSTGAIKKVTYYDINKINPPGASYVENAKLTHDLAQAQNVRSPFVDNNKLSLTSNQMHSFKLRDTNPISSFENSNFNLNSRTTSYLVPPAVIPRMENHLVNDGTNRFASPIRQQGQEPNFELSSTQLAARQVLPKDLPFFSGNPQDWPIFISCFERTTRVCGYSDEENLIRLQKSLKGKALDSVRSQLLLPNLVENIIETLRMLFGRPEAVIFSLIEAVRNKPAPRAERLETLIDFALSVQNLCSTMEASDLAAHLCNPTLIYELENKLPATIKLNWAMHKQTTPFATLSTFSDWLFQMAKAASSVCSPFIDPQTETKSDRRSNKNRGYLNSHVESSYNKTAAQSSDINDGRLSKICVICKKDRHNLEDCDIFKQYNYTAKWIAINKNRICLKCLGKHRSSQCVNSKTCNINNCQSKHHPLLHKDRTDMETPQKNRAAETHRICNTHRQPVSQHVLFRVVPAILYGPKTAEKTFAFLDEGSSLTLIEEGLADKLKVSGTPESLCLKWTADTIRREPESRRIALAISGTYSGATKYSISNIRTVKNLNLPVQSTSMVKLDEKYPHLEGVPVQLYTDAKPRILIGIDNWKLGLPLQVREGKENSPVATKTRLGWTLHGFYNEDYTSHPESIQHHSYHIYSCQFKNELHDMVKSFFSIENLGVKIPDATLESQEDKRARAIMVTTTVRKGNRFETGLLWKYDNIRLPNSYNMAYSRMKCLEKQMSSNPALGEKIREKIRDHLEKKYIRKLSKEETEMQQTPIWYLPIFAVINPNKPNKIRIVWDAAATVDGISLNSVLLKGPDQLTLLPFVIYKFREKLIALTGDIREMFHQVVIRDVDQQAQRFLWRDHSRMQPDVYVVQVMTFGASCSPSLAQYIKNTNALQFADKYPKATRMIIDNHYVDDMLCSVDTSDEAIKLANEVKLIHANAGFEIRNWVSSSSKVLAALNEAPATVSKNLLIESMPTAEKVLGMWWCPSSDTFTYSLKYNKANKEVLTGKQRPTKREVLRTLMSIYDPLGLLASFLVYAKILLQEIWRTPLEWDDQLIDELNDKWLRWIQFLPKIEQIHIPRCYSCVPLIERKTTQLHVFVDASRAACAAVAYLRTESKDQIECALIGAKTKISPQKPITIPRMELQAALMGARLARSIIEGHSIKIDKKFLWSDSKTVLSWLKSDPRKYRQFVAFRIGEILELTEITEWYWIAGTLNVADEATKWMKIVNFETNNPWFKGPAFLYEEEKQWHNVGVNDEADVVEELNPCYFTGITHHDDFVDVKRFSKWCRLVHTMAYVIRFRNNLRSKIHQKPLSFGPVTSEEYSLAENRLYQIAQHEHYACEIQILRRNNSNLSIKKPTIPNNSRLYNRSPYLDESGTLRVKGRIDATVAVNFDVKRPILLPNKHRITYLLVDHYHRKYHHHNHETVVNEIRQSYDISKLRVLVKKVSQTCQICKNQRAKPLAPEMSDLPHARLAAYTRPFTFVGIDYFGPLYVTVGRHTEKRWGVLFTCLTVRAIHIEIAYTLSTNSCIMAIRNFVARRGMPAELYSDNGTNFRGADEELRKETQKIDATRIQEECFPYSKMKWKFNPPSAPHMGGSWERLIRSVKRTLKHISPSRNLCDESLRSLLMEVENIVNSRPLTYIPVGSSNDEALTPNHFLLGSSNGDKPLGEFNDNHLILRKNWRITQQLANCFWKRWIREYLPDLTRRTKWFNPVAPIKNGDIVVIVDETQPRNCWKKGIVVETTEGRSGQVRSAVVQTPNGLTCRPAVKLAVLDVRNEDLVERPDRSIYREGGC